MFVKDIYTQIVIMELYGPYVPLTIIAKLLLFFVIMIRLRMLGGHWTTLSKVTFGKNSKVIK